MQKEAAKKLIRDTLEQPFDKVQFARFAGNLVNHLEPAPFPQPRTGQYIFADFREYISSYDRIGKYEDSDGNKLDVLIVNLSRQTSLDRARSAQRKFVAKYLKESQGGQLKDAALVAFVSPDEQDWRFSFVRMEYKIETTPTGRVRVKDDFTPAHRYSFLVGQYENSHTAQSRLIPILEDTEHDPTIADLEDAFSVESVTKEFFEQYRELYLKVKEALDKLVAKDKDIRGDFEERGVDTVDFAKKLLGQIVFLYFLQKKGWFGVKRKAAWGTGSKGFLRELFQSKHGQYRNFFNDILEPLFYNTLAVERPENYSDRFDCKIPFLNGGLFDPLNNYDWVNTDILLPDDLFSNDEKTRQGDIGTGILDVFDRYNFTVKEDEPLEKEVAVDPEMLGKVFENLLEVKDRKSKGTYYTPREIVHYMCQESLINYLATQLGGEVELIDIETLVRHGETAQENDALVTERGEERGRYKYMLPVSIRENAEVIDKNLASIKVCDPAVGSGAFLVGMMSEIIRTRIVLSELLGDQGDRTPYDLKRHAIQNSLYGVDIDLGAVEIAKLRLWLSLIVDEDDYRQIKPLPNLDYKIMQGNSLLEEYEGIKLIDERFFEKQEEKAVVRARFEREQSQLQREYIRLNGVGQLTKIKKAEFEKRLKALDKQLKELDKPKMNGQDDLGLYGKTELLSKAEKLLALHEAFFSAYNKRQKDSLRQQIDALTWDLIETTLSQQKKTAQLKDVKRFQETNTRPFFLWRLNFAEVFREKEGFDVFLANPPYVRVDEIDSSLKDAYKRLFDSANGKYDLYYLFFENAIRLLKSNGNYVFITPNKYCAADSGKELRSKIFSATARGKIVSTSRLKVFAAASNYPIVSASVLGRADSPAWTVVEAASVSDLYMIRAEKSYSASCNELLDLPYGVIPINIGQDQFDLVKRLCHKARPLSELVQISEGLRIPTKYEKESQSDFGIVKQFQFSRYSAIAPGTYISRRGLSSVTSLSAPRIVNMLKEKLVIAEDALRISATIDSEHRIVQGGVYYAVPKSEVTSIRVVLALLNSGVLSFLYKVLFGGMHMGGGYMRYRSRFLEVLPLPKDSTWQDTEMRRSIEKSVEQIYQHMTTINDPNSKAIAATDKELDRIISRLYALTPEEIEIIENATTK